MRMKEQQPVDERSKKGAEQTAAHVLLWIGPSRTRQQGMALTADVTVTVPGSQGGSVEEEDHQSLSGDRISARPSLLIQDQSGL
ncbi:hypothetical protein ACOMHN_047690 [Nucella lapillus]